LFFRWSRFVITTAKRQTLRVAADLMSAAREARGRARDAKDSGESRLADRLTRKAWGYERQAEALMRTKIRA